jgi:Gas vesicle synthesis protein GvpL/GvpF
VKGAGQPGGREAAGDGSAGDGWYVYGVVPSAEVSQDVFGALRGVDPSAGVAVVAEGGLAAISSPVSLSDFGEGPLEENLRDPAWLEDKVRAHESVLEAALGTVPLVPFRFGTICRSEEQVRALLREHPHLASTLDRLRGSIELGVKAFVDPARFAATRRDPADAEGVGGGRAYLLRKQSQLRLDDERDAFKRTCADDSHPRLAAAAEDARSNPLQQPEVVGHTGEMLLNGAYLVRADRADIFQAALADLEAAYGSDGVDYVLTGPWPPYNFVDSEET